VPRQATFGWRSGLRMVDGPGAVGVDRRRTPSAWPAVTSPGPGTRVAPTLRRMRCAPATVRWRWRKAPRRCGGDRSARRCGQVGGRGGAQPVTAEVGEQGVGRSPVGGVALPRDQPGPHEFVNQPAHAGAGERLWVPEPMHMSRDVLIAVEEAADAVLSLDLADPGRRAMGEWP